jgi:hypothetical protein
MSTQAQTKWLPKLLGFDYEISYKKGKDNVAADALSRVQNSGELAALILTNVQSNLLPRVLQSWEGDAKVQEIIRKLKANPASCPKYTWVHDQLRRKGRLVIGKDTELRKELLLSFHGDSVGGHSGVLATYKRIGAVFYWKGLKNDVKKMVAECDICQRNKSDLAAYPGLMQPLPIPDKVWNDISMDFIEQLPKSQGRSVIMVVVDRLSKYSHFIALSHPYTASSVATAFMDNVYKLHGLLATIVSDRDRVFLSLF